MRLGSVDAYIRRRNNFICLRNESSVELGGSPGMEMESLTGALPVGEGLSGGPAVQSTKTCADPGRHDGTGRDGSAARGSAGGDGAAGTVR